MRLLLLFLSVVPLLAADGPAFDYMPVFQKENGVYTSLDIHGNPTPVQAHCLGQGGTPWCSPKGLVRKDTLTTHTNAEWYPIKHERCLPQMTPADVAAPHHGDPGYLCKAYNTRMNSFKRPRSDISREVMRQSLNSEFNGGFGANVHEDLFVGWSDSQVNHPTDWSAFGPNQRMYNLRVWRGPPPFTSQEWDTSHSHGPRPFDGGRGYRYFTDATQPVWAHHNPTKTELRIVQNPTAQANINYDEAHRKRVMYKTGTLHPALFRIQEYDTASGTNKDSIASCITHYDHTNLGFGTQCEGANGAQTWNNNYCVAGIGDYGNEFSRCHGNYAAQCLHSVDGSRNYPDFMRFVFRRDAPTAPSTDEERASLWTDGNTEIHVTEHAKVTCVGNTEADSSHWWSTPRGGAEDYSISGGVSSYQLSSYLPYSYFDWFSYPSSSAWYNRRVGGINNIKQYDEAWTSAGISTPTPVPGISMAGMVQEEFIATGVFGGKSGMGLAFYQGSVGYCPSGLPQSAEVESVNGISKYGTSGSETEGIILRPAVVPLKGSNERAEGNPCHQTYTGAVKCYGYCGAKADRCSRGRVGGDEDSMINSNYGEASISLDKYASCANTVRQYYFSDERPTYQRPVFNALTDVGAQYTDSTNKNKRLKASFRVTDGPRGYKKEPIVSSWVPFSCGGLLANHSCPANGICPESGGVQCSGNGFCSLSGRCRCLQEYSGLACEHRLPDSVINNVIHGGAGAHSVSFTCQDLKDADICSGNGNCRNVEIGGRFIPMCDCAEGWSTADTSAYAIGLFYQYAPTNKLWADVVLPNNGRVKPGTWVDYEYMITTYMYTHQCLWWVGHPSNYEAQYEKPTFDTTTTDGQIAYDAYASVAKHGPQWFRGNATRHPGFRCANGGAGPGCQPCDDCGGHGVCVPRHDPVFGNWIRNECVCHENWISPPASIGTTWNSRQLPQCAMRRCPTQYTEAGSATSHQCSSDLAQGTCVVDDEDWPRVCSTTSCDTTKFVGKCHCKNGYGGEFCEKRLCPEDNHGWVCGNNPRLMNDTHPAGDHGVCLNTTGTCQCASGWTGPACSLPACASYNGMECAGAVRFVSKGIPPGNEDTNTSTNPNRTTTVCNRETQECECWRTLATPFYTEAFGSAYYKGVAVALDVVDNTANGRWGPTCTNTYKDSCSNANGFCSGNHGIGCQSLNRTDNLLAPTCRCYGGWKGEFCEKSVCGDNNCDISNHTEGSSHSTGTCLFHCTNPHTGGDFPCNQHHYEWQQLSGTGECKCSGEVFNSVVFYGPSCNEPTTSCTDVNGNICNNHGSCERYNDTHISEHDLETGFVSVGLEDAFKCRCEDGWDSTADRCMHQVACFECHENQVCNRLSNTTYECGSCKSNFNGTDCAHERCISSGGNDTYGNGQHCSCPKGSVWYSEPTPESGQGIGWRGCRKLCPLYYSRHDHTVTPRECGSDQIDGGTPTRCSAIVHANDPSPLTCSCDFIAYDHSTDHRQWWVSDDVGGCEPYCVHGYPSQSNPHLALTDGCGGCTQEGYKGLPAHTGTRCNDTLCSNNHESISATGDCTCKFPWTGSDCSVDSCTTNGGFHSGSSLSCSCPGKVRQWNSDTSMCVSLCTHGGTPNANGTTCTGCDVGWTGDLCEITRCAHGGSFDASQGKCHCSILLPQWGGTFCDESQCVHGHPRNDTGPGCVCNPFYVPEGGLHNEASSGKLCTVNLCTQSGGTLIGNECLCPTGRAKNGSASPCGRSECGWGTPSACSGLGCEDSSYNYNCDCGEFANFISGTCIANPALCVHGRLVLGADGPPTGCDCSAGYNGTHCNITDHKSVCPSYTNPHWTLEPSTGACFCSTPWTGPSCEDYSLCGPSNAVLGAPIEEKTCSDATTGEKCDNSSSVFRCSCAYGYIESPLFINGVHRCVPDCNLFGTANLNTESGNKQSGGAVYDTLVVTGTYPDKCICLDGWSGEFCAIRDPEAGQSFFERHGIALIMSAGGLVAVGITVAGIVTALKRRKGQLPGMVKRARGYKVANASRAETTPLRDYPGQNISDAQVVSDES